MAVTVELKLRDENGGEISSVSADATVNNVSKPVLWDNTVKNSGFHGISLGRGFISFENGYVGGRNGFLQEYGGYNGYMWGAADGAGKYDLELTLTGIGIDGVTLYFDKTARQWATVAVLDKGTANERTVSNDDYILSVLFKTAANTHTINLTNWNIPNYNACITHISILLDKLTFNQRWIKEVASAAQSQPEQSEPYFGVIPNSGNLELVDVGGELLNYAKDGILTGKEYPVRVFANGKQLQYHLAGDAQYNAENRAVEFRLTNPLDKWNETQFLGMPMLNEPKSAYYVLSYILDRLGYSSAEIAEMCDTVIVAPCVVTSSPPQPWGYGYNYEVTAKVYLENIMIPNAHLSASTYRAAIEKVCRLAQLQCYANDDGVIKFVSARPFATDAEKASAVIVPAKAQVSPFKQSVFVKNNYDGIKIVYRNRITDNTTLARFNLAMENEDGGTLPDIPITPSYEVLESVTKNPTNGSSYYTIDLYRIKLRHSDFVKYTNMNLSINRSFYTEDWTAPGAGTVKSNITEAFHGNDTSIINEYADFDAFIDSFDFEDETFDMGSWFQVGINSNKTYNECELYIYALREAYKDYPTNSRKNITYFFNFSISSDTIAFETKEKLYGATHNNILTVSENELLNDGTAIGAEPMYSILEIINIDYDGGVATAEQDVVCIDLKDEAGNIVKDFTGKGEVLKVGDIIKPLNGDGAPIAITGEGASKPFRVVGRSFVKVGYPRMKLYLTEVKNIL